MQGRSQVRGEQQQKHEWQCKKLGPVKVEARSGTGHQQKVEIQSPMAGIISAWKLWGTKACLRKRGKERSETTDLAEVI